MVEMTSVLDIEFWITLWLERRIPFNPDGAVVLTRS